MRASLYLCCFTLFVVCVFGAGQPPGTYTITSLDGGCYVQRASSGSTAFTTAPAGEPNSNAGGLEIQTPTGDDQVQFLSLNTNPDGFGSVDTTFSATYTFYLRGNAGGQAAPAMLLYIDTEQPNQVDSTTGNTNSWDKIFVYEPTYNGQLSYNAYNTFTWTYNNGKIWLGDRSSSFENCKWDASGANSDTCSPPIAFNECYRSGQSCTTQQNSDGVAGCSCTAPAAGASSQPPLSGWFNTNSDHPVGQVYGSVFSDKSTIVGFGINLGSGNAGVDAVLTRMAITTSQGTRTYNYASSESAAAPCQAGPCEPGTSSVSLTPNSNTINGNNLPRFSDVNYDLRLSYDRTGANANQATTFNYQCLITYPSGLRFISGQSCHGIQYTVSGAATASAICNFKQPDNSLNSAFSSNAGYTGQIRSTLRFANNAAAVGSTITVTATCSVVDADSDCTNTFATFTGASTPLTVTASSDCTGAANCADSTCPTDFVIRPSAGNANANQVQLRVTNGGDFYACADPDNSGQLINVCSLLKTLQR